MALISLGVINLKAPDAHDNIAGIYNCMLLRAEMPRG